MCIYILINIMLINIFYLISSFQPVADIKKMASSLLNPNGAYQLSSLTILSSYRVQLTLN